jgi:hypothetical protein
MAGLVGIAALARLLARRERAARRETAALPAPDPAEELRRKLSESRDVPEAPAVPPGAPPAEEPTESLEERRARVHAKAQETMGAMEALAPAEAEATEAQEPRP